MSLPEPTTTAVETAHLYQISQIVSRASRWNEALDQIIPLTRALIIFDNLAVYIADPLSHHLEVMFARAVGRGRSAEADISWGETLANRIMDSPAIIVEDPPEDADDRLKQTYALGIPIMVGKAPLGVVVFVRFGGPPFSKHYIELADFIAQQIGLLVERQNLQRAYKLLATQSEESRLQEDFISTITHELRTPLGFIKGYTTTLLRSDTSWDQASQQEFLKIIDQETDRLQELIENLLDSARLQSGTLKMDFQAVRLDTLIKSSWERIAMHNPGLIVHTEIGRNNPPVIGDPKRLGQVFENLFNNAIKYAPGSPIWVRINVDENEASITVEDKGPGIAQRYLPHLFDRFFRNPDISPSVHGTGLGLFICKKIIQAHEGQISATSQVGEGTKFHIHLPIKQSAVQPLQALEEE
jgi:two-component system sensor histidine kinase KdpD